MKRIFFIFLAVVMTSGISFSEAYISAEERTRILTEMKEAQNQAISGMKEIHREVLAKIKLAEMMAKTSPFATDNKEINKQIKKCFENAARDFKEISRLILEAIGEIRQGCLNFTKIEERTKKIDELEKSAVNFMAEGIRLSR